ncbi:hypothetical protein HDU89_003710 [Geranomyces variabilis]|nr:hypothetical protein HDU89_003710 [Geranomyces variabilis]
MGKGKKAKKQSHAAPPPPGGKTPGGGAPLSTGHATAKASSETGCSSRAPNAKELNPNAHPPGRNTPGGGQPRIGQRANGKAKTRFPLRQYDLLAKQLRMDTFDPQAFAQATCCQTEASCKGRIVAILRKIKDDGNVNLKQDTLDVALNYKFEEDRDWVSWWSRLRMQAAMKRDGATYVSKLGKHTMEALFSDSEDDEEEARTAKRQRVADPYSPTPVPQNAGPSLKPTRPVPSLASLASLSSSPKVPTGLESGSAGPLANASEDDSEDDDFAITSSQTTDTSNTSEESVDKVPKTLSDLTTGFLQAGEMRDTSNDTVLPSGLVLEEEIMKFGLLHADKEHLEHSWIVALNSEFARAFSEEDRSFLEKKWSGLRTSTALLDGDGRTEAMVARGEDLAGCLAELEELEALCDDDDIDAGTVFKTIAKMPVIREGENPTKYSKIVGLRMALQVLFREWSFGDTTITSEASVFEELWDVIFKNIRARGLQVAARETTIITSKHRKLRTYKDVKNVRGLKADKAWLTKSGIILAWGEGKEHSWTANPEEGTSCRNKAIKGSKDYADYVMERTGRSVETFAVVWLATDIQIFATVALPSEVCLTRAVVDLPMPTCIEAFGQLAALMRRLLAWVTVLEDAAKVLNKEICHRSTVPHMASAVTPKKQ